MHTPGSLQREHRAGGRAHTHSRVAPPMGRHLLHPQVTAPPTYSRGLGCAWRDAAICQPVKKKAKKATASEAQRDPWGHALLGPNSVEVPYLPPAASAAAAASTAAAALLRYPATVAERRRHRVFCELHERGYAPRISSPKSNPNLSPEPHPNPPLPRRLRETMERRTGRQREREV